LGYLEEEDGKNETTNQYGDIRVYLVGKVSVVDFKL
jgi:hypothetical protein